LLLNTSLSVEEGMPGSHAGPAWTLVTDAILKAVAAKKEPVVAMLWGNHAKAKKPLLGYNVKVLEAGHPSPLSVSKFFGCKHFSQANQYLVSKGAAPIDWTKIDLED
jgi:uracil-DNA glycosylase